VASRRKRAKKPRKISLRELERIERRIEKVREQGIRAPRGWAPKKEVPVTRVKRKAKVLRTEDLKRIAEDAGTDVMLDAARWYHFHPDEWAEDIGDDFDLDVHGLYEQYFYPSKET
jgi:hypothetical protein